MRKVPAGFQPGNKMQTIGNQRRAGALRQIKDLLAEAVSEDDIIDMLAVQVMKAKTGNTDACRLVLSYRLGTPDQVQSYVKERPKVLNIAYVNASPTGAPMPADVDREEGMVEGGGGTHPAPTTHQHPINSPGVDTQGDSSQIIDADFSDSPDDGTISEIESDRIQRDVSEIMAEAVEDMVDAGLSPLGGERVE